MSFLSLATLQTWTTRKYRQSSLWRLAEKWHEGSTSVIRLCNSSSFDERNPSRFCHTNWQQRDKSVKRIYLKEWGKNEDNRCLMMRLIKTCPDYNGYSIFFFYKYNGYSIYRRIGVNNPENQCSCQFFWKNPSKSEG